MATSETASVLIVGAMIIGTVFVGASAGDVFTDDPDPDELVEAVVTAPHEFDTLEGIRTREITVKKVDPERSMTSRIEETVWLDLPNRSRTDVTAAHATPRTANGDVLLINGSTLKRYKAEGEVMVVDRNWESGQQPLESDILLDDYETEYRGTETIAGRDTHVVEITPAPNGSVKAALTFHLGSSNFGVMTVRGDRDENQSYSYTTTWWIDIEMMYPIKERIEWKPTDPQEHPENVESKIRTYKYESITFNDSIPADRFTFTPPNGTEVYHASEPLDIDTVEEADAATPFAVPDPPLPERFELVQAGGDEFEGNVTVNLLYSDGEKLSESDTVRIEWFEGPAKHADKRIVEENAGEMNATVVEYESGPVVVYDCGDVRVRISAGIIDRDDRDFAMGLADRMGCQ